MIIPLLWGSMDAAAAAATTAATATFVKSLISLQVLKRLLSLLVYPENLKESSLS